jgi:IS4 transposase
MNEGKYVFAQLMSFLPKYEFQKCVDKYSGDYKTQWFNCRIHFWTMCFAQLTFRESLRDIENSLIALSGRLYHCGIPQPVPRSTLSDANEIRDWRIYSDFAGILAAEARVLYKTDNDFQLDIENMVYAFDSTTIDLCLNLFPWAKFRQNKGAVKMHTLLDVRGNIPSFIHITDGLCHDVNALDLLPVEQGAFYLMDKGYIDYSRLYSMHQQQAFFVTRAKDNMAYKRLYSQPVDKTTGLKCDQIISLTGYYAKKDYPELLRRVKYYDTENQRTFEYLTNNFLVSAITIAKLYKERWHVELFFKWIKQHLRIKAFYGTSFNAVCIQIWCAVCVYLLVAIVKRKLNMEQSLYTILQTLNLCLFEKTPINQLFEKQIYRLKDHDDCNQLKLFDL